MASVVDFLNSNPKEVTRIVDTTFFALTEDYSSVWADLCPLKDYLDAQLLILKFNRSKPTIGSIVGADTELPIHKAKATITEELLAETRIGKQFVFRNAHFKAMQKLEQMMNQRNVPAVLVQQLQEVIFGFASDLSPALVEKMYLLCVKILTTGNVSYTDPLTDIKFDINYPDAITSGVNQLLYTNVPLVADDWSTAATANGLLELELHASNWRKNFGYFPINMYLRYELLLDLKQQTTTKFAAASSRGYVPVGGDVSGVFVDIDELIELIKMRTKVKEVIIFDAQYSEENASGVVTDYYFMPANTYMFAEPGNCESATVPTPEKEFEPGVFVVAERTNTLPRVERLGGLISGIPAVYDPRKIAAKRVKIAAA
jgi:hypothetical protein